MKDAVIIGSGPGGYYCALKLARLGKDVAIIEEGDVGGTCTNVGCIPTKALLESARILHEARTSGRMGIECEPRLDFRKARENADVATTRSRKGIEQLLDQADVELLRGHAKVTEANAIEVSGKDEGTVTAENIVIATGSSTRDLPNIACDGEMILSSRDMLNLDHVPESLLIIGGGSIGLEFASIFGTFGSKVTIVELLSNLLPMESAIVGSTMEKILKRRGVDIHTNVAVSDIDISGKDCCAHVGEDEIRADRVLLSVGRIPNVPEELIRLGVKLNKMGVVVNEQMQTAVPHIYAIGDVVGEPMLAHSAWAEGEVAALNIAGRAAKMEYEHIPRCIYTFPEIACFGLTEERVRERHDIKVGEFPLVANARARISGEREGFARIFVEKDKILGGCVIAPHATEMIQELVLAARLGLSYKEIAKTVHPHPTVVEAVMEAAHDVDGESLHKSTST